MPRAGLADTITQDLALEQLLSTLGDRADIEAEQTCDLTVAPVAPLEGFKPGIKSALLLIQKAVEQKDRGPEFVRQDRFTDWLCDPLACLLGLASAAQLPPFGWSGPRRSTGNDRYGDHESAGHFA